MAANYIARNTRLCGWDIVRRYFSPKYCLPYNRPDRAECFVRSAESMFELAISVTLNYVSIDNTAAVAADTEFSNLSGKDLADFGRLTFTISTKKGIEATICRRLKW